MAKAPKNPKKAAKAAPAPPPPFTAEENAAIQSITDDWKRQIRKQNPDGADTEIDSILSTLQQARPGSVTDGVVQPCPGKPKKPPRSYCAPPSENTRMQFSDDLVDAVKKNVADRYDDKRNRRPGGGILPPPASASCSL